MLNQRIDQALQLSIPILMRGRPERRLTVIEQQTLFDTIEHMSRVLGWRPEGETSIPTEEAMPNVATPRGGGRGNRRGGARTRSRTRR